MYSSVNTTLTCLTVRSSQVHQSNDVECTVLHSPQLGHADRHARATTHLFGEGSTHNEQHVHLLGLDGHYIPFPGTSLVSIRLVVTYSQSFLFSGELLIKKLLDKNQPYPKFIFKCLFPASSSAFFVQYVISCIFLNNALQLLRMSELFTYWFNCILVPKTGAEYWRARQETKFEFNPGCNISRYLLVFTMVVTYSVACPIIAPLGKPTLCNQSFESIKAACRCRLVVHGFQALGRPLLHLLFVQHAHHPSQHIPEFHSVRSGVLLVFVASNMRILEHSR